ncbi:MAG: bifunctional diaminohydroxyphosphoribosylaminopyrimidine deaminase/5-amino-6-(5-phosphoribosylamino)uracil reductase RibD [Rhodanobacteraceae bacterium]|nr:MAG: bifunctional diaminohydroxyphosphoribosylaminopyrimidine deaminase/5-amino-6-(5-phosphoribosylamino)uracil reductase RibD [Rhodanobacteraceae bacterium]
MARALRLAARGLYTTQPNPRVGCVLVQAGEIVGEGWHQRASEPHAEVFALRAAGVRACGATAYVTLEPCAHFGKTPPCADALLAAGIARVVVASRDPNPKVAGAGLQRLREAGVAVEPGLMKAAARDLNRGFFARFERGRPWVRVKLAMSLDGRTALANGESKWITSAAARADVQRWRARSSALLTAAGTARADDPRLTVRLHAFEPLSPRERGRGEGTRSDVATAEPPPGASCDHGAPGHGCQPYPNGEGNRFVPPLRVVLDARLDALALHANLLDGSAPTLVLHAPGAQPRDDRHARCELAATPLDAHGRHLDLDAALRLLAARGVNEVQVEAGPALCGALFAQDLVDELLVYIAPTLLGDSARPLLRLPGLASLAERREWRSVDRRQLGIDTRVLLRPAAL